MNDNHQPHPSRQQHPSIDTSNATRNNNNTMMMMRMIKDYYRHMDDIHNDDDDDIHTGNTAAQQQQQESSQMQLLILQLTKEEVDDHQYHYHHRHHRNATNNNLHEYGLLDVMYYYCYLSILFSVCLALAFLTYQCILYPYFICPSPNATQYYPIHLDYTTTTTPISITSTIPARNPSPMIVATATIPVQLPTPVSDWSLRTSKPYHYYNIQIQLELPDSYSNRYHSSMFTIKYQLLHAPTTSSISNTTTVPKKTEDYENVTQIHHRSPPPVEPQQTSTTNIQSPPRPILESRSNSSDDDDIRLGSPEDNTLDRPLLNHYQPTQILHNDNGVTESSHGNDNISITSTHRPMDANIHSENSIPSSKTTSTTTILTSPPSNPTFSSSTKDSGIVVLDIITRSYRYPYRSPIMTWLMNMVYIVPNLMNMAPSTSFLSSSPKHHKHIWESQIIADTIVHDYNISHQPHALNTVVLEVFQFQVQTIGPHVNSNHLIEIVGGSVIIGPEYTRLQQIVMLDFYYTCTVTITILISFVYFGIIHYLVSLRQRSSNRINPSHTRHFHHMNGTYDGPFVDEDDFDDVHNFDYMNDLHVEGDDGDEIFHNNKDDDRSDDWIPLNNNDNCTNSFNHYSTEQNSAPAKQNSNVRECEKGDDDHDLFFDAVPFPLVNENLPNNHKDDIIHAVRISDNFVPHQACTIVSGKEMTAPSSASSAMVKDPTMAPRNEVFAPSIHGRESLQQSQQQQAHQHSLLQGTRMDSTDVLQGDTGQSILLPTATDCHRTIVCDSKDGSNHSSGNSNAVPPKFDTPSPNDTVIDKQIFGDDDRRTVISTCTKVMPSSQSPPTTSLHVSMPPQPPSSLSPSRDHNNDPFSINAKNSDINHNVTTMDTDEIPIIQFLWTELKRRNQSSNLTAMASSATDAHTDYTNHQNDDNKTRSLDNTTNDYDCDGMYEECPFLAIFLS